MSGIILETVLETILYGTSLLKDFTQKIHIGTYMFANASSFRFPTLFFVAIIFCYDMYYAKVRFPIGHSDNIVSLVVVFYS